MDKPLTPEKQNAILEDALHTYPMILMSHDLTVQIMSQIQAIPMQARLRLNGNDLILSAVIAICVGAIWFSVENLPPLIVAQIRRETILLYQQILVNARWLVPALSFGLAGFFVALTIPLLRRELRK
jgi:hypothetical protein